MIPSHITAAFLNEKFTGNMLQHIGIEYTEVGSDYLCGKMPVDERTKQPLGLLHGGASVVLAESLGSMAANLCIDQNTQLCVGMEINANHVKSVTNGYVYGKATARHIGKKTQIWETLIHDEKNNLVCISRLTIAVLNK